MKIAVLISGGVDSSVALRLLKDEGHDLTAFYLKIWLEDEMSYLGECPWKEDLAYIRQVCDSAKVPLEVVNMQKEYWDNVVNYTISEARAGRTPNPDIFCNQKVKFGKFYDYIDPSYEKVATGHYALVCENSKSQLSNSSAGVRKTLRSPSDKENSKFKTQNPKTYLLIKSHDPIKDQTYFLAHLSQEQLSRAMFPIGKYTKDEVRKLAEKYNLPNKNRKDSQGICFLGKVPFRGFIKHHLGEKPGDFIDVQSKKTVGGHSGYWFYTIGQRYGLGLSGGPWFVVGKNVKKNAVYLARGYEPELVYRTGFNVDKLHWITSEFPISNFQFSNKSEVRNSKLEVKIRHGAASHSCRLEIKGDKGKVELSEKVHGVAPGQFAVFYSDDICLGCGTIVGGDLNFS
jgi:tRNA-5-taurinomethyluridine 2-sulfurtransferase